ncbi:glutamine synthetase family protein [Streptomyces sp. RB6PN25]|uniref:Glutamine synthetase family protein n=1 Tax=Streptomyces humicola TaxID=2953240 RepID=A0ABT1Q3U5_9ACTN|nr:glutamine synthetase family protein [Streptomyces humicola]MCQ4083450.1 glutamine synthetase family protein [Streptomyces humicola]
MALARQEAARLGADGIHVIALAWVDNAGITRVKAVPTDRLPHAATHGVGMSPVFDVFTFDDAITASPHIAGPDGDLRLFPDLDRITPLAAQPGWAWAPVDRLTQQGEPHPACQRQFARRMAARAAERGLELRMGFETEWVVMRPGPDGGLDAEYRGPAYGMTRVVEASDYLRDIVQALRAEELSVLQIHPEYSPGQFEVSTAAGDPVRAADDLVLVRETIRAVSARHGLQAVFAPSVVAGQVGNGCHLHLSLAREGVNLYQGGSGPHGMTHTGESFLAGVLDALPALLAVGAPSPAGYLRLQPSRWAGPFRCWGLENREAAVRFITGAPGESDAANAEIKCFDATANPYLTVGSVIAAGLAGLDAGLRLPAPVQGDPAGQSPPVERLPSTLTEAADRFEHSAMLRDALGEVLHGAVLAVRRAEDERFAAAGPEEITSATRGRY